MIVASAGFGKTLALNDFIASYHPNVLRLDLRPQHSTLLAFVKALSEAVAPIAPGALATFTALQERVLSAKEPVRELSDWLVEHLKQTVCTIVIDDLHYAATDSASIALLADVVERTSGNISWIIASRTDAGLPLATWIAYGRMDMPIGEEDLRFTSDEALAVSQQIGASIEPHEIEALRRLTDGWPVALSIALRTRTHARDLPSAATGARDIVYRYLAEQIFNSLTQEQRAFLLSSSVFTTFDTAIAESLGAAPQFLAALRRDVTFLTEISPNQYRYHDLFRDFLESELRRSGTKEWLATIQAAAILLEGRADQSGAIALYVRANDNNAIVRIIESHGLELFERGEGESLRLAIEKLPSEQQQRHAMVLGIRAMLEAARGHFEISEAGFIAAIAGATDNHLRLNLVHRYAVELVRQGRDAITLLSPYAEDPSVPQAFQVSILGTLATAYARTRQLPIAQSTIQRALSLADAELSTDMRARLYQQAAFIYQFQESATARKYADLAIELALSGNLYDVAARASSVLFAIAYNESAAPSTLLPILAKLGEYARKAGSEQTKLYGLIASYDLQVERGEERALEELDRELDESRAALPVISNLMLLPARAMRKMWSRNFSSAVQLLRSAVQQTSDPGARAVTAAQLSLCSFAGGLEESGAVGAREAEEILRTKAIRPSQQIRAHIFLALSELIRGRSGSANVHIVAAEQLSSPQMPQLAAFTQAVRILSQLQLGQTDIAHWKRSLERLRSSDFGGIARMLEALPAKTESSDAFATLTPAEKHILQQLALGPSTKDIAQETGRSPQTIDTHIRSICRKLGCSGRREAVALATGKGWVQAQTLGTTEP